jgi:hypothetical protein
VVLHAVFMAHDLAIHLVHELVHSGIQVEMGAFCKQVASLDVDVAFRSLPFLFSFCFSTVSSTLTSTT